MIKDSVRTDGYRRFIEENPEIFRGKTVLDIGCGSGILSLFCARAGAAKVIAVDNSDIIHTARLIINANGYDDKITCVRGKIEEVTLPVQQVDIIVSEWMGYALLFEAMFDSVIWARDRYLRPGGLMVPSHCNLHLAVVNRDRSLDEKRTFWTDVYGFNMLPMVENDSFDQENVRIEFPDKQDIVGPSCCILDLNAHTVAVKDLSFKNEFSLSLDQDMDCLAGWVIWFDIGFLPDPRVSLYKEIEAAGPVDGSVTFTTGPDGPETHWKCAFMATHRRGSDTLKAGTKLIGHVQYEKAANSARGLEISIDWEGEGSREKGKQQWLLS
jgi:type I protein arginine methyltransferase